MAARAISTKPTDRGLRFRLDGTEPLLRAVVRERAVRSRSDVLREGDRPTNAHILLDGHACRYKVLKDGRRQITAFLVPGDMCDLSAVVRGEVDHGVGALTDCILGEIPAERVTDPATFDPEMIQALLRRLLHDEAISREWLVNLGRRDALERVAHLICELHVRLEAVGLASGGEFQMHFTQLEFADVAGLSTVHINRILQQLRRTGLIALSGGTLTMLDMPALKGLAGFDPSYLKMA